MLISKTVDIKWNSKNKKWYTDHGYHFTKMGDIFSVNVEDLTSGSHVDILVECDYCHKQYVMKWYTYLNRTSGIKNDCCIDCRSDKTKESVLAKYGVNNVFCLDSVKEKIKTTNIERYGAENPFASEQIKEKITNTVHEKYGVDFIRQSEDVNNKIEQTNIIRYGCKSSLGNLAVREKAQKTILEKYGVEKIGYLNKGRNLKENSPLWKGGYEYHKQLRSTDEYRKWRRSVFLRDNYTCQCCGRRIFRDENGKFFMNAHHIKCFVDNPSVRFDIDNGVTLCRDCHKLLHSEYGVHTTTADYDNFIRCHGKKVC